MKFDKIIMNPPYNRGLHLKILAKAIEHLKDENSVCVNLSPTPCLTSIRNLYDSNIIAINSKIDVYKQIVYVDKIKNGIELFGAGIQQHLGIQVYRTKKHPINLEEFVDSPLPKNLVCKIMDKCISNSLLKAKQSGDYELPISRIHGHINCKDFLNIMAMSYERQLASIGRIKVKFDSEKCRHDFYNFWMSPIGRLVVSLWKIDTNVEKKYIPYVWFNNCEDFYKYFDITEDEKKIIEETMKEYTK